MLKWCKFEHNKSLLLSLLIAAQSSCVDNTGGSATHQYLRASVRDSTTLFILDSGIGAKLNSVAIGFTEEPTYSPYYILPQEGEWECNGYQLGWVRTAGFSAPVPVPQLGDSFKFKLNGRDILTVPRHAVAVLDVKAGDTLTLPRTVKIDLAPLLNQGGRTKEVLVGLQGASDVGFVTFKERKIDSATLDSSTVLSFPVTDQPEDNYLTFEIRLHEDYPNADNIESRAEVVVSQRIFVVWKR